MTMQMPTEQASDDNPILSAEASRDMGLRRGGGIQTDKPPISYRHYREAIEAGAGKSLANYGIVMRMPDKRGAPGAGPVVLMPANKATKWFGQGYRFCAGERRGDGSFDDTLIVHRTDSTPRRWVRSMVEDGMALGEPIPEEMADPGYTGPTFSLKAQRDAQVAEGPVITSPPEVAVALTPDAVNLVPMNGENDWQLGVVAEPEPREIDLDDYSLKGLKTLAEEFGVTPDDARSATKLKVQLAAHLGQESDDDINPHV